MVVPSRKPATIPDVMARDDRDRLEIIGGEIVERAMPSPNHSLTGGKIFVAVDPFNRRPGGRGPGGWWIFIGIHTGYPSGELYCHDAAGWRRDRLPTRPTEWPIVVRPDWVCEVMSPKHERKDQIIKPRVLHAAEVPHYWLIDPEEQLLLVHRWSRDGYVIVQRATIGETVRAEPFDAIEIEVGELFGIEPEET